MAQLKDIFILTLILMTVGACSDGDVSGCIDSRSSNYNPDATIDDGSCIYPRDEFLGAYSSTLNCLPAVENYNLNEINNILIQANDNDNEAVDVIFSDVEVETQFSQLIPMTLIFKGEVVGDELRFETVDAHRAYVQGFRMRLNGTLKRDDQGTLEGRITMSNFDEITRMEVIRSFTCNYVFTKK